MNYPTVTTVVLRQDLEAAMGGSSPDQCVPQPLNVHLKMTDLKKKRCFEKRNFRVFIPEFRIGDKMYSANAALTTTAGFLLPCTKIYDSARVISASIKTLHSSRFSLSTRQCIPNRMRRFSSRCNHYH